MSVAAHDHSAALQQSVLEAIERQSPVRIVGGGSKSFYGRSVLGEPLNVSGHYGIVSYHPSELVVTARAGTRIADLENTLAAQGQMLAFEPPHFGESATLGGTLACGFSGPRRPFAGSARDCVLGCRIINGKGEILSFGGEVIKNVAGFDVSRLMVGALGTLGVLLDVSLKVLPRPKFEETRTLALTVTQALARMNSLASSPLPVSGLAYDGRLLHVRLSGSERAVKAASERLGGDAGAGDPGFWKRLNEQRLDFFRNDAALWRLSLPSATPPLALPGDWFYDWAGGLRWLKSAVEPNEVFAAAVRARGHAVLFKGCRRESEVFQPLAGKLKDLNCNVKRAFDPHGLFNADRPYEAG